MYCTFMIVSLPQNANLEHQQINFIAGQNCLYYNFSQRENAVPEHEQIVPLQEGTALSERFEPEKAFLTISK